MKSAYDWAVRSAWWLGNASYNALANIPETFWNALPTSLMGDTRHAEQEILLAQDVLQDKTPLDERMGVIESHNAYASKGDIAASNQQLPLKEQLDTGMPTVIELDIHPDRSGSVRLCHGDSSDICLTTNTLTFEGALKIIRDHADSHPDRVFIINLEDRSLAIDREPQSTFDTVASALESVLGDRLWFAADTGKYCDTSRPRSCVTYPTPDQMLHSGKNIAVASQCYRGTSTLYEGSGQKQMAFLQNTLLGRWREHGVIDSSNCTIDGNPIARTRITEDGMFIKLGQQTFNTDDLTHASKCGASTLALDHITPGRSLEGLTWLKTDTGALPKDGQAFITTEGRVDTVLSTQDIPSPKKHAACLDVETLRNRHNFTDTITRPKDRTAWRITSSEIEWQQADAACKSEFGMKSTFATPTNGFEYAALCRNGTESWINLELSHPSQNTLCLSTSINGEATCVTNNYTSAPVVYTRLSELVSNASVTLGYSLVMPHVNKFFRDTCGEEVAWYATKGIQYSAILLGATSSLTSMAIGSGVEYGLNKTGWVSPGTASHIGNATYLTLMAAQKTTYWGVAELLAHSACAAIGSYLGEATVNKYKFQILIGSDASHSLDQDAVATQKKSEGKFL